MKILKIKIKLIDHPDGSVLYYYPVDYKADKINILVYGGEIIENDEKFLYCIGLVDDSYRTTLPQDVVMEISKEEANQLGQEWRPQTMKITNQKLVDDIIMRLKRGIPLTWMEIKALDPRDKQVGINYSKEFDIHDWC